MLIRVTLDFRTFVSIITNYSIFYFVQTRVNYYLLPVISGPNSKIFLGVRDMIHFPTFNCKVVRFRNEMLFISGEHNGS